MVFNKDDSNPKWDEELCHRWFKSYLKTPEFDKSTHKSYMFSGEDFSEIEKDLPNIFKPYYDHMCSLDNRYNQVVVNYYEQGKDFIPFHRDWTTGMVDKYEISIITLNKNDDNPRTFEIIPRDDIKDNDYKSKKISVELNNGLILTMGSRRKLCFQATIPSREGGKFQDKFRHGIPCFLQEKDSINQRFGITFRQFI